METKQQRFNRLFPAPVPLTASEVAEKKARAKQIAYMNQQDQLSFTVSGGYSFDPGH